MDHELSEQCRTKGAKVIQRRKDAKSAASHCKTIAAVIFESKRQQKQVFFAIGYPLNMRLSKAPCVSLVVNDPLSERSAKQT